MKTLDPRNDVLCGYLRTVAPFERLGEGECAALARRALLRCYDKGETVFRRGERAAALCCLVRGAVRVVRGLADGREKVIHLHQAPTLVAEAPALLGAVYPARCEATEEALILAIPREALLGAAAEAPELLLKLLAEVFGRLRELTGALAAQARRGTSLRVASYLLGLGCAGDRVELPGAKKDVASYLGLRPESLSRALAALQRDGAIRVDESEIVILDRARLEAELGES